MSQVIKRAMVLPRRRLIEGYTSLLYTAYRFTYGVLSCAVPVILQYCSTVAVEMHGERCRENERETEREREREIEGERDKGRKRGMEKALRPVASCRMRGEKRMRTEEIDI